MMKSTTFVTWLAAACCCAAAAQGGQSPQAVGVVVPEGFEVTLFADEDLANDIYSMTVDSQGRVAVAGRGFVRLLLDHDGDGQADEARQFSDLPASGAQGMYFDGNDLLCTGDGAILRLRDADGDGRADGPPERILAVKTGGEHDTHAVRKGPDGWWYVIAGNGAGVDGRFASLPTSPIRSPNAGALYRLTPDFTQSEVIADGFRNAYDFDFNAQGDLFVFDSDGERDVSLPWYVPTRVFHALPGSSAGWFSRSWKRPDYFLDMPPVVGSFGRGSPTGVECYRHRPFPELYHGAVFIADWTFGRIIALPLETNGSTYQSEPIEFMTGVGTFGFAPTDLAVGPDGSLYVSVGGRGTRGSVFRVRYTGEPATAAELPPADRLAHCLACPQPLSSWSRAAWEPLADQLGRNAFAQAALDATRADNERVRAVEILVERFGGLHADETQELVVDDSPRVRARAAWALRHLTQLAPDRGIELAMAFLQDPQPLVARAVLESLLSQGVVHASTEVGELLVKQLDSNDRFVRQTAARVIARLPDDVFAEGVASAAGRSPRAHLAALYAASLGGRMNRSAALRFAAKTAADESLPDEMRVDGARIAQLALGDVGGEAGFADVFDGYSGPLTDLAADPSVAGALAALASAYPTSVADVDRESARALALGGLADPDLLDRVLHKITSDSHPVDDVHQLIVAARLPTDRSDAQREVIATALVAIDGKVRALRLNQDLHWDARIGELYEQLVRLDGQLPAAVAARPDFGGPGSLLFLGEMPEPVRAAAIEKIVSRIRSDNDYPWSGDLVFAIADSQTPEHVELVRSKADDHRVRGAVSIALAKRPHLADRDLFMAGLQSAAPEVVESCLAALDALPAAADARELAALVKLVRRLGTEKQEIAHRDAAIRLLARNTGMDFAYEFASKNPQAEAVARWTAWLTETHPEAAEEYLGGGANELVSLLEQVNWQAGDAGRGQEIFVTRSCTQCHQGRGTVGPDLTGVTKRFSREDILTAIVDPSRDVSSRYATTAIETTAGRVYTGLVIYQSVDGVTLRDGLNQTIRIEAEEIESQRTVTVSLMPAGLLDGLSPQELADLFSYLATL
jgi:putative membrane-bound dehydrogenase-like protein